MNEMKELEIQLSGWAPRRPSAKLERRLFGRRSVAQTPAPVSFRLSWLAPATGALLLMGVVFSQRNSPAISGSASSAPLVAMILSNQSAAAYLPGSFQRDQNTIPAGTFEWTNGDGSLFSIRSLSRVKGN